MTSLLSLHSPHSASYVTPSALATVSRNVRIGMVKLLWIALPNYLNIQYIYTQIWLQNQMFFINQNALWGWFQYQNQINSYQWKWFQSLTKYKPLMFDTWCMISRHAFCIESGFKVKEISQNSDTDGAKVSTPRPKANPKEIKPNLIFRTGLTPFSVRL